MQMGLIASVAVAIASFEAGVIADMLIDKYQRAHEELPVEVPEEDMEVVPFSTLTCDATLSSDCKKNFLFNNPEYEITDIVYATDETVVYSVKKTD
jgi:hypothetical protein